MGSWNNAQAALPRPMNGLRATNIDDMVLIFGMTNLFLISDFTVFDGIRILVVS